MWKELIGYFKYCCSLIICEHSDQEVNFYLKTIIGKKRYTVSFPYDYSAVLKIGESEYNSFYIDTHLLLIKRYQSKILEDTGIYVPLHVFDDFITRYIKNVYYYNRVFSVDGILEKHGFIEKETK